MAITQQKIDDLKSEITLEIEDLRMKIIDLNGQLDLIQSEKGIACSEMNNKKLMLSTIDELEKKWNQ